MIPAAAIEAAFLRIADNLDDTETESWKGLLRLSLESAAPHMLAGAWEEGCREGLSWNPGHDEQALAENPYRPTP